MAKAKSYIHRIQVPEGMHLSDFKRTFARNFASASGKAGAEIVKANIDRKCKADNVLAVEMRGPLSRRQHGLVVNHRYGAPALHV
jgi:hypothetical protein